MAQNRLGESAQQIADDIKEMFDRVADDDKTSANKAPTADATKVEIRGIEGKK